MVSKNKPPVDFDDNPEWTEEDFAKARPASEIHGLEAAALLVRKRGRPAGSVAAVKKEQVTVRLDPSILAALRAGGPGWQSRMNDLLHKALGV